MKYTSVHKDKAGACLEVVDLAILATRSPPELGEGWILIGCYVRSALPSSTDLQRLSTIDDLRAFLHVGDDLWGAILHQIGDPGPSWTSFSRSCSTPPTSHRSILSFGHTSCGGQPDGGASHSCGAVVADIQKNDPPDVDPWAVVSGNAADGAKQTEGTVAGQSSGGQVKERVLKMSSLLDQGDDSEFVPATREQIDVWLTSYVSIRSVPREEEEPSEGQLAALHTRVFILKGSPYCDFAIWTPFSRKNLRLQKLRICMCPWVMDRF